MTDHETELSKLAMSQSLHQVATLAGALVRGSGQRPQDVTIH